MESPVSDDGKSKHVRSEHVTALADEQVVQGHVKVGGPGKHKQMNVCGTSSVHIRQ